MDVSLMSVFNEEQRLEMKRELKAIVREVFVEVLKEGTRSASTSFGVNEAKSRLGIGRKALMDLVKQGKISHRKNGNRYVFNESDIEQYKRKTNQISKIKGV